jgi:hypothetical protein
MGLGDEQTAVLVDTRADWQGKRGLVLHHPRLAKMREAKERKVVPGTTSIRTTAIPWEATMRGGGWRPSSRCW